MPKKTPKQPRPTGTDRTVQKGLMQIYSNSDGSLPDISHLEVRRRGRFTALILALIGFIGIVGGIAWLAYTLFVGAGDGGSKSLRLEIISDEKIASGDEITYTFEYENIDTVPLREVEFIFRLPDGFMFKQAEPEADNEFNTTWTIGDIAPGEKNQIVITGTMIGEVGSVKALSVTASFRPDNFSSTFKETETFHSEIESSILELQVEGPTEILIEKQTTYTITYKNNDDQELSNIRVQVEYPKNFVFQEASPEPFFRDEDARRLNNQWVIETLGPKQEGQIEITGGYIPDDGVNSVDLKVQIGFIDSENDQDFSLQQETTLTTDLVNPNLNLDLIINGSTQGQPVSFGQTLNYSIVYKNLGQKELDDISISITIDSPVVDLSELEDKNNGTVDGNTVTWTQDEISGFDLLRPLDEGSIDFTIPVIDVDDVDDVASVLNVISKAQASTKKIGELELEDEITIESNEIINAISTDVEFQASARYFNEDNIAVGTGPLPPVVGQTTSFRIYWSISNSLHELEDVTVTTILPSSVDWEDKFLLSTGDISYSAATNQVTWSISDIDRNQSFEDVTAWFDVSVTPSKAQAGKLLILAEQPVLSATDVVTESAVTRTGKTVTSNLEDDIAGSGRGLVVDISE